MFERFNRSAGRVLYLARVEAEAQRSPFVNSGHLFLGALRVGGVTGRVLGKLVDLDRARAELERLTQVQTVLESPPDMIPFSDGATSVFQRAREENDVVSPDGRGLIESEHLLLALLKERNLVAHQLLHQLGVEAQEIRDRVLREIENPGQVE